MEGECMKVWHINISIHMNKFHAQRSIILWRAVLLYPAHVELFTGLKRSAYCGKPPRFEHFPTREIIFYLTMYFSIRLSCLSVCMSVCLSHPSSYLSIIRVTHYQPKVLYMSMWGREGDSTMWGREGDSTMWGREGDSTMNPSTSNRSTDSLQNLFWEPSTI